MASILPFILLCAAVCIEYTSSLCSSYDYAKKIRAIISLQNDYEVYEGNLSFRLNDSAHYGTNPSGMYGNPYFENIENISNPHSIAPHYSYYLRPSSALILAICTPPQSVYFSLTQYIYDRFNDYEPGSHDNHKMLWADLGASLNNLVWNTTANSISDNYDSLTTVIITSDNVTYNDIYSRFIANGLTANEMNLQSLPNEYIEFLPYKYNTNNIHQYNKTYDIGSFLLRVSLPQNKQDYQQYIHTNQTIFLLNPNNINPDSTQPKEPFEPFRRNPYSPANFNETTVYKDILKQYENDLINYIETTYNLSYVKSSTFWNAAYGIYNSTDYGFGCIEQNENCGGDCRDAQYWQLNPFKNNKDNEFNIILGVIHENPDIQQAMYSNIVIEDRSVGNSLVITNFEYNGSGLILPVKTTVNKNYLQNIFVVQWTSSNLCIDGLPGFCAEDNSLSPTIFIRDYLNPITKTRPIMSELVHSVLVKFKQ